MDNYLICERQGEFLEEYYGKRSWYLSLSYGHSPDYSLKISFVTYDVVGHYRGEDSGAFYPEYSDASPVITYGLSHEVHNTLHLGNSVSSMIEKLINDKANWKPLYRHYDLVSFLIGHPDLIISSNGIDKDCFTQRCLGIVSYATLNFVIPSENSSPLLVKNEDLIVAKYDIRDICRYFLFPKDSSSAYRRYPIDITNYPVYLNFDLMDALRDSPKLLLLSNHFDGFSCFVG